MANKIFYLHRANEQQKDAIEGILPLINEFISWALAVVSVANGVLSAANETVRVSNFILNNTILCSEIDCHPMQIVLDQADTILANGQQIMSNINQDQLQSWDHDLNNYSKMQ